MSILLTLAIRSLATRMSKNGEEPLSLCDVPDFAIRHLQLRGLSVPASMLAGWSLTDLDKLRDRADKAGCPCLVLVEDAPLAFGSSTDVAEATSERVHRLAVAANRLGCNALALCCESVDSDESLERTAGHLKTLMPSVERFELNMLLAPAKGLTSCPDRLTELIKGVGGFRIGSLPDFAHAADSGDPVEALRKQAPNAGAIHATVAGFAPDGVWGNCSTPGTLLRERAPS